MSNQRPDVVCERCGRDALPHGIYCYSCQMTVDESHIEGMWDWIKASEDERRAKEAAWENKPPQPQPTSWFFKRGGGIR